MLKNNTVLKILSLITAICLWFYVVGEINPTTRKTINHIPVTFINEDTLEQRGLAVKDEATFSVDIVVSGKKADVNALERGQIEATANLFGYEEGSNDVPVAVELPEGVSLVEVKTPKIRVDLEELISVYKKIQVSFRGETPKGTEPGDVSVSPVEIEVKGAKSAVNSVDHVRATVDASKITDETQTFNATPAAINKQGDTVYGVEFSAKTVGVQAILYYVKTVPLDVDTKGRISDAYEVVSVKVPEKIAIKGAADKIKDIKKITAKPVDISKVTASTTLPIDPILPSRVEVANQSKNIGIEIEIKGISSKRIKLSTKNCQMNNLGEGLTANVNTAEVYVTVTGSEDLLQNASPEDFILQVDLENLKEDVHSVPVSVTGNKAFYSIKVNPEKVEVTIKREV